MQVNIFSICKNDEFSTLNEKYTKQICKFSKIKITNLFNKNIANAQNLGKEAAQKAYEQTLNLHKKGFCILLDERGEQLLSSEFAELLKDKSEINFFIGGAYGFSKTYKDEFNFALSLSKMTLAHNFVKLMLLEQIYRAFCINSNHPYHKD